MDTPNASIVRASLNPALRARIYGEDEHRPHSSRARKAGWRQAGRCIPSPIDELRGCLGCARDGLNRPAPVSYLRLAIPKETLT